MNEHMSFSQVSILIPALFIMNLRVYIKRVG